MKSFYNIKQYQVPLTKVYLHVKFNAALLQCMMYTEPEFLVTTLFFGLCGFWTGQNIESQIWLYSVRWGDNKWPVRPLGGELQCGGLWPLCEGLEHGGSSVEEGVGQPVGVP